MLSDISVHLNISKNHYNFHYGRKSTTYCPIMDVIKKRRKKKLEQALNVDKVEKVT